MLKPLHFCKLKDETFDYRKMGSCLPLFEVSLFWQRQRDGKRRRDSTGEKACRAKLASRSRGHFKKLFYRRREHAEKLDIFASEKGKRKSLNNLSKHFKYIFYFRKTLDVVVDTLEWLRDVLTVLKQKTSLSLHFGDVLRRLSVLCSLHGFLHSHQKQTRTLSYNYAIFKALERISKSWTYII